MHVQVVSNISNCLADMHAAGYVHRDLKPGNIMWLPRQNRWTVIDFGCAARVGQDAPLSFTLAYAAPEVLRAVSLKQHGITVMPALDSWSLGVMAFELLTGAPAFDFVSEGHVQVCRHSTILPHNDNTHIRTGNCTTVMYKRCCAVGFPRWTGWTNHARTASFAP